MEDLTIRRRNRLRHHYTMTSNVLLFGYHHLSDAAKVTYLAIDSFDWGDGTGKRKGYAYPSLGRLARDRALDRRTIRRHLTELEAVGLLTRQKRPGRPNLLIIEDPSTQESERYLQQLPDGGSDRTVLPTPDRTVRPYKKQKREEDKFVNGEEPQFGLENRPKSSPRSKEEREYLAQEMLAVLKDEHSLGFYRKVAETVPQHRIFETLSEIRIAVRQGDIQTSRGALFTAMLKRKASALSPQTAKTKNQHL